MCPGHVPTARPDRSRLRPGFLDGSELDRFDDLQSLVTLTKGASRAAPRTLDPVAAWSIRVEAHVPKVGFFLMCIECLPSAAHADEVAPYRRKTEEELRYLRTE